MQSKIDLINKILLGMVFIGVLYLGITFVSYLSGAKAPDIPTSQDKVNISVPEVPLVEKDPPLPITSLQSVMRGRIFRPPSLKEVPRGREKRTDHDKPDFVLRGIVWSERGALAVIQKKGESEVDLLKVGDSISGFRVIGIEKKVIRLEKGGKETTIKLKY